MQNAGKEMLFSVTRVGPLALHVKNIDLNPMPATESINFMGIVGLTTKLPEDKQK